MEMTSGGSLQQRRETAVVAMITTTVNTTTAVQPLSDTKVASRARKAQTRHAGSSGCGARFYSSSPHQTPALSGADPLSQLQVALSATQKQGGLLSATSCRCSKQRFE
jgi:hypothetical protein